MADKTEQTPDITETQAQAPAVRHRRVGTKQEVWDGTAERTVGGLKKADLALNKHGRACSSKKQAIGKALYEKNKLSRFKYESKAEAKVEE